MKVIFTIKINGLYKNTNIKSVVKVLGLNFFGRFLFIGIACQ